MVRTDTEPVKCVLGGNGRTRGWIIKHDDAVEKKAYTSITKWFGQDLTAAKKVQKQWEEKINGGELVPEKSTQIDANQTNTRYSLDRARMCEGLEKSILETRETGSDSGMKKARRIQKERIKKAKIGKRSGQAGDGNNSDAEDLGGEEANMTDA